MIRSDKFEQRVPITSWDVQVVEFGNADEDLEIRHNLTPQDPEQIDVQVLEASGPPLVYKDTSATRKPWNRGIIRLRSAIPGLKARLLLTTPLEGRELLTGGAKILPALVGISNTFSQQQFVSLNGGSTQIGNSNTSGAYLHLSGPLPIIDISETDQGTNQKRWRHIVDGAIYTFRTLLDSFGNLLDLYSFDRNGRMTLHQGQLTFPATQNPSSDPNTLDDYVEGTWTPILIGTGGQSGQTYLTQSGRYLKVGRLVHFQARLQLSALGTFTGNIRVDGLPFTISNFGTHFGGISVGHFAALGTAVVWFGGFYVNNTTQVELQKLTAAATTVSGVFQADLTASTLLLFSGTYIAAN